MRDKAVLIAGAGIAGPTLAYWLSVAGFRPTLIERAPALRSGGYVIDFWGLGYDIAERMGLLSDINRIGYHARELRIVGDRGERLAGFGTSVFQELTNGRYVTVGRSDLSRLLFEKAKSASDVIFGDQIVALREQADGVEVRFRHGGERRFDLVIGADGLHSGVRRLAFGPQHQFEKSLGYAVAAVEVAGYRPRDEDIYLMYGLPGRMLGRFTLREDRTLFLFVFTAANDPLPEALDAQKATLRRRYADGKWECPPILDDVSAAKDIYFDRVSQIQMDRWSKGRVALIGDAAFCVSLAAGQGSALAMISAYVLAGELLRAEGRHETAFQNYEAILRDFIAKKQRGAGRFAAALAPRTPFGLWFRNLVIKSFAIPGLATFAVGRDMIDALSLPEYAWPPGGADSRSD
jgi:2-polyprenyl-6-methoxyphenol hydroxylase-like FAD-dependent oxidoreductase